MYSKINFSSGVIRQDQIITFYWEKKEIKTLTNTITKQITNTYDKTLNPLNNKQ